MQVPRTEAIRPDHIDPSFQTDSTGGTHPGIDTLDRQPTGRGRPRPSQRRSDPFPDENSPTALAPAPNVSNVKESELSRRQVGMREREEPQPDPTEMFGPDPDRKLSRRERKRLSEFEEQQQQSLGQWFKEILLLGIVAVGTAILLTTYLVQAFFIPSISMEDTLLVNDRVLVNKAAYKFSEPAFGDIVVFISPEGNLAPPPADTPYARFMDKLAIGIGLKSSEQDLIKRVIATEGQTFEVKLGLVFVDDKQLVESYRKDDNPMPDVPPTVIPDNHVFVLGDNRSNSGDSRKFGPVAESEIIGKAVVRIWPMERIQKLR